MAKKDKQQQGAIPKRGIVTDTSFLNQPPGTLTFALNTVSESDEGDKGWRSNEQSNEACYQLPAGFVPIGEIFIDNNTTVIFSVTKDGSLSEIGLATEDCKYTTEVRADLGFRIDNQIKGTYRLRRGCERMIYFTTPVPMVYNLDKPTDFWEDPSAMSSPWDIDKFKLFRTYEQIPVVDDIEILENGLLKPGSYNASIQYLDNDLNPTEWITTTEPIRIYNNSNTRDYETIRGSTSVVDDITNFGITNKAIKFTFSDFDDSYPFYRVAIIESNSGNGLVTGVKFSAPISIANTTFTYSGDTTALTEGTEEEILFFNNVIDSAEYITQIENRLILGQTKGTQVNFCNLQKYASKITADLVFKEISLNSIDSADPKTKANPKNETVDFNGSGYMPGEIYSFGIVYIFDDSTTSPVYHIPGRNEAYTSQMSANNKSVENKYQDNSNCKDYWGRDSEGQVLTGLSVRHHRFPLRSEINEPLFTKGTNGSSPTNNVLTLTVEGTGPDTLPPEGFVGISYRVTYLVDGVPQLFQEDGSFTTESEEVNVTTQIYSGSGVVTNVVIEENYDFTGWIVVNSGDTGLSGLTYTTDLQQNAININNVPYTSRIMGIEFSGIEPPKKEETGNRQVVGYYIVRNERTEEDKTILDSGVVTPMLIQDKGFVVHGHLYPELADKSSIDKDIFGLIHPENKFNSNEYKNTEEIIIEGFYNKGTQSRSSVLTQDVGTGSSYNPDIHKNGSKDTDGFSLHTLTRDTETEYVTANQVLIDNASPGEIFYLNTLNSKSVTDSDMETQEVFNISGDNKIGIIKRESDVSDPTIVHDKLPYVILKRNIGDPYRNYRSIPYLKESKNPNYFTTDELSGVSEASTEIFNGDSYITPMRYHSAVFNNFKLKQRETKSGTWKIILGGLLVVAGIVGAVFSGGGTLAVAAAGLSIAAAGYGISTIASGIETNQVSRVYEELYEAGLRETLQDDDTQAVFNPTQLDDEMQWLGDTATNLWFESSVNMGLRHGTTVAITDFLNAPNVLSTPGLFDGTQNATNTPSRPLDNYLIEKLTVIDTDNEDGRLYKGYAGAELYLLNNDYKRLNKQKLYYALGLEYDCCSDCLEDFPQRVHFSEQSFQEELTDNYRTFLPNNYRDIEGEKGVITDIFRIQNNLYIHTEGALWHLPQNIQERITGDVVSFIGTGEFFSIPPRKITDDDKESAGTRHNWGTIKTANGTLFISADEGKVFLFDGNSLNPIASGNEHWFKANLPVRADRDYKRTSGFDYPLANNPSNEFGTGYLSVYDTHKERFIITKRDFIFDEEITNQTDYRLCYSEGNLINFENYSQIIADREADGWTYEGLTRCLMEFTRTTFIGGDIIFEVEYEEGLAKEDPIKYDLSWTMSYSLEDREWISWHSYLPNFYFYRLQEFYSWKEGETSLFKHNKENHYQTFYGQLYPHIMEYVDNRGATQTKIWDYFTIISKALEYNDNYRDYVDKDVTFNKMIAYTSKQTTGLITLEPKVDNENYLYDQVTNGMYAVPINRAERNWYVNDLRDIVVDYTIPMFKKDYDSLKAEYYTDKVLNDDAINYFKDWSELQSFRDKYLVMRLIFDNFDNIRLVTNFTEEMINPSMR